MKILKNSSLCILLPLLMLYGGFTTTHDTNTIFTDEFEIVAVSSGGPHGGGQVCSSIIQIVKSATAPIPDAIIAHVSVMGDHLTMQEITIDKLGKFTNPVNVKFHNLFNSHAGTTCKVNYYIEVYLAGNLVATSWASELVEVSTICSASD